MAQKLIRITDRDNVAVALESLPQGSVLEIDGITLTTGSNMDTKWPFSTSRKGRV